MLTAQRNSYGDPFLSLVPAVVQFDSTYTVSTFEGASQPFDHYLSLTVPTEQLQGLKV